MKTDTREHQLPLSEGELAQIDLTRYACYPEVLFVNVIVQRGGYWHTALLQLQAGKVRHSTVNPIQFTREEDARAVCEDAHYRMQYLLTIVLPDFDIHPIWFK